MKRYPFYLLFALAYIGSLVLEKPTISGTLSCITYMPTFVVHFVLMVLITWVNNGFLIPHLWEKKRFSEYVSGLVTAIALYTLLDRGYHTYVNGSLFYNKNYGTFAYIVESVAFAAIYIAIASVQYITEKWSEQRIQVKNIQISQLQTELKYLRSQINPHFLFNGLNTIYGYIDMNNHQARDIMVQFSDLLRYNLYEADVDMIELEKEIKYLQNYVALQKARSTDNMQISLKLNYRDGKVKIAPLIFMAFVENAFKYVSRGDNAENSINIKLTEKAGRIDFVCDNTYEEAEPAPGGIGLSNTVRRLELLYKDHYKLDIKKDQNIFHVQLMLTP